ncbi:related to CDC23-cell division control protein [Sporisorium reilianum SRZ2]|uniref:Related to CDC23-cell division control protein n=1 Tax=Sporisorium reilianum (strain SRZ2) TaxID=999809 RepID=E6ZL63_SPORE|nr:related to CDC23-cell division control protein [Sporisorium reilianum SRZ2]
MSDSTVFDVDYPFPDLDPARARASLRFAALELSERGLASSSRWTLELLQSVPYVELPSDRHFLSTQSRSDDSAMGTSTPATKRRSNARSHIPEHSTPALGMHQRMSVEPGAEDASAGETSGRFAPTAFASSPLVNTRLSRMPSSRDDPDSSLITVDSEDGAAPASAHVHWQSNTNSVDCSPGASQLRLGGASSAASTLEEESYLLAKSHFDQHQLERCIWVLENSKSTSDKARFLWLYARFLISERKLDEHGMIIPKPHGTLPATSPSLIPILKELIDASDAFLLFLKGAILRKLDRPIEAMDCLIRSVQSFAYNWAAWQELAMTLEPGEADQMADLLPESFMVSFFREFLDRHSAQEGDGTITRIDRLLESFPRSAYLLTCRAQTNVHRLDYIEAEQDFQEAWSIDPYRIDGLADYSNALYLLNRTAELAHLAHKFSSFAKDRPEVCCLVGNYYNQRSDHHRAIEAFRHALRLDSGCVPAWILLGHEYIELKNSHAAAEMYRRALKINPREYRALYGLGQVYELNGAYTYAVNYFQKCAAIRPYDGRMWSSMGICYDHLARSQDAISCFKRYLACRLNQGDTVLGLTRIIEVYEKERDFEAAACYHRRLVQVVDRALAGAESNMVARYARSYIIAARWEMGEIGAKAAQQQQQQRTEVGGVDTADDMEQDGEQASAAKVGNLALANDYLQKVIAAGTEMTDSAEILLKRLAFLRD